MIKIYVHDFYFNKGGIDGLNLDSEYCNSVNVFFNYSQEDPGDGWDDLEYFNITVATPFGLAQYLKKRIANGDLPKLFFFPYILIVDQFNEDDVVSFIKKELESIIGKTKNEVLLKAMRKFSWEHENTPHVYNRLFAK